VLTALVLLVGCVVAQVAMLRLSTSMGAGVKAAVREASRTRLFVVLFALSLFGCWVLVAVRGLKGAVWDDYLLPWLPLFLILLALLLYRSGMEPRWRLGWIALVLFAAYGIAATHDYYAESRVRVQIAAQLEAAGIPRSQISGGVEFNGWTQLLAAGHICDPGANPPAGDPACQESVKPQYFLAFSPVTDFVWSRFAPVSYRTWLPPFRGQVLTLTHSQSNR